jgi:hypothetical protein
MSWLQQVNGWTIAIVIGLATSIIATLCAVVWRQGPVGYSAGKRLWLGAQKAPHAAWAAGVSMTLCIVLAVGTSIALAGMAPDPRSSASPAPVASSAPSLTSTHVATPQPVAVAQGGWGPARDLARHEVRPTSAMLNSVVDDPLAGDERAFMAVRLANDENASWSDSVVAIPGRTYEVGINVNNDAKDGGKAAEGVQLRVEMPGVAHTTTAVSQTFVTSSNVTPGKIWAGITFVNKGSFDYALRYVSNSAVLQTDGDANGERLSDQLFTDGVPIGCDALDGVLPAGDRCRTWVTFKVRIDQPNFEVAASMKVDGTDAWSETYAPEAGEAVTVRAQYTNTGTTMQDDIVFKLNLPSNVHYLDGTAFLANPWNESLHLDNDENISKDIGVNVGSYAPQQSAVVSFDVILDAPLENMGGAQVLEEFLTVDTNGGRKYAQLTLIWFQ